MLSIEEAYELFEDIKNPSPTRWWTLGDDEELEVNGVILSNYIHKSFGRTYFRTRINIVGNFTLGHQYDYVSYQLYEHKRGHDAIESTESIFKTQLLDAVKLKTRIKELFPDISVQLSMMDFEISRWYDDREVSMDSLILTGEPELEIVEPMDEETRFWFESMKETQDRYKEEYAERKARMKAYRDKKREERKRQAIHDARVRELHEIEIKQNSVPHNGIKKIERKARSFN
jgi:hypothetical protein